MKPVVIESPYAGKADEFPWPLRAIVAWWRRQRNIAYLRAAMRDAILRGETPYASHALLTQPGVLRDWIAEERELGIRAGFHLAEALARAGAPRAFYRDRGTSLGMRFGEKHAAEIGQPVEERSIPGWRKAS